MFGRSPGTLTISKMSIAMASKCVLLRQNEKGDSGIMTVLMKTRSDLAGLSFESSVGSPCLREDGIGISCGILTDGVTVVHFVKIREAGALRGITQNSRDFPAMRRTLTNVGARMNPNIFAGPEGGQIPAGATLTPLCRAEKGQGGRRAAGAHLARGGSSSSNGKGIEASEGL